MGSPGDGCITKRKDGRWQGSLQVDGRRRAVYGQTRQEVKAKLQALQREASISGGVPQPGRRTVDDLLNLWLEAVTPTLKPKTLQGYRDICNYYIRPNIGHVRLARLAPEHLQRLYSKLQKRGLKRAPEFAHVLLHRALTLAVLWRWLSENPADRVIRPTYQAGHKKMWTVEQLSTFLDGTRDHWLHPLFVILAVTGCRIGEARGLKWEDVQANTVTIKRTLHYIKGEFVESTPKTRSGVRTIVLPEDGVLALRKQKIQQTEWRLAAGERWQPSNYVFTNREGRPLYQWHVQHTMAEVCKRLGLPRLTPHGMRHLHASLLLSRGLPLTDVSARLGHANPNITASVYAHVIPGRDAEAARVMESVLRGGGAR